MFKHFATKDDPNRPEALLHTNGMKRKQIVVISINKI